MYFLKIINMHVQFYFLNSFKIFLKQLNIDFYKQVKFLNKRIENFKKKIFPKSIDFLKNI